MFVVQKGEGKKNRFVTHYETTYFSEIKIESIKQAKIQTSPKIKEKEKDQIKIIEKKNNIIIPPKIPRNLFCILHNQNQAPISPPKFAAPHLKKKRFIDDDTGNTIGRWSRDEHKKFIEAIIKFGNNWKEVQEYVNTRTSTQARSHAQKFFEKIKKNNTLKFFDSLDSDYSENFTNATILQLHKSYGNKSKSEINSIVNKFLSLEYDLPKKRRKMMNNNLNGIAKKKNNGNNYRKNNDINEDYEENEIYEEPDENKESKEDNNNNNEENNENNRNNNQNDNYKNIIYNNMIMENPSFQEYILNNNRLYNEQMSQKLKLNDDINKYMYFDNYNQNYTNNIGYILNQFVNNLSYNVDLNSNDLRLKLNKRKNTIESLGEESLLVQDGNLNNLNNLNQTNNIGITKSRKNSVDSANKMTQNEKNSFNNFYKKIFGPEEINQNKSPFEINDLKNPIIFEEDLPMN